MAVSTVVQLLLLIALISVIQLVILLLWYPHIDAPVNDKVKKFTSSTLREVRKLIRRRPEEAIAEPSAFNNRVAVLVPYLGEKLPAWFDMFMMTASSSADLFDWYIFIDDAPLIATPSNVKLIQISAEVLYKRLARLDTRRYVDDAEFMTLAVQRLIEHHPYVLVEFKPCLGFLFHDYIESYSHWAYADLDTLVGRIPEHLTQEHLNSFDIISYSFGDNYRLYLRGQLTIVRNSPLTNNLWKECQHLSSLGTRLDSFVHNAKADTNDRSSGWRFQSAEGCFSKVAMDSRNVSIIYLSSQLSDAFTAPRAQKESLMLGHSIVRCHQKGLNLEKDYTALSELMASESSLIKSKRKTSHRAGRSDLQLIGQPSSNIPLKRLRNIRCSYWIEPTFDVCVSELPSSANVVKLLDPVTGQPTLSYHIVPEYEIFPRSTEEEEDESTSSTCREASIVHFQGWKHNFGSFVSRPPSGDAQVMLITETGLIPLRVAPPGIADRTALNTSSEGLVSALPTFSTLFDQSVLYSGRLIPIDIAPSRTAPVQPKTKRLRSRKAEKDAIEEEESLEPGVEEEEEAAEREEEERPGGDEESPSLIDRLTRTSSAQATRYCGGYSKDLKYCSCYIQSGDIEVLLRPSRSSEQSKSKRKRRSVKSGDDVTMVLVAWDFDLYDRSLDPLLSGWDGPKVVVLAKTKESSSKQIPSSALKGDTSILLVNLGQCLSFINQDASPPHYLLPDNMLFNVGLDVVSTDLVLLVPSLAHSSRRVSLRSWKGSSVGLAVQLRQQLSSLKAALSIPERTHVFTYSNSPALVIPLYVVVDEESVGDGESSAAAVPSLHKYPLSNSWCGESQPSSLQLSFETVVSESVSEPLPIPFDSKELLKERTLMLPVLFNSSAGPHGRDFVRFPEELSGHGCYGSASLRVLAGSGYTLYWATGGEYLSVGNKIRESTPDGDFVLNELACGCSYGNDANAQRDLTNRINSYYLRAVELRTKGLGSVFTGEPFGKQFEKNTMTE